MIYLNSRKEMINMTKPFETIKTVSYYECNNRLMLTKANLALFLQEAAIEHSDSIGYSTKSLLDIKRGWIITNWHIVFEKTPVFGDTVTIKTWSEGCKHFLAGRSYTVSDSKGNILVKASSRWVYMNLEERKPDTITKEMADRYSCDTPPVFEKERFKMPKEAEREADFIYNATVLRSQTDTNGHTNNTQYIAWAMDAVPDEIYNNMNGYDLRVVYRKESYKGNSVSIRTYIDDIDGEKQINTFITSPDKDIIYAQVTSLWKK